MRGLVKIIVCLLLIFIGITGCAANPEKEKSTERETSFVNDERCTNGSLSIPRERNGVVISDEICEKIVEKCNGRIFFKGDTFNVEELCTEFIDNHEVVRGFRMAFQNMFSDKLHLSSNEIVCNIDVRISVSYDEKKIMFSYKLNQILIR